MKRMTTRPNALAHLQSFDHLITRAILLHYLTTLVLYNSRIKTQDLLIAEWSLWILAIVYDPNLNCSVGKNIQSLLLVCQFIMGLKVFMYVLGSVNVTWEKRKLKQQQLFKKESFRNNSQYFLLSEDSIKHLYLISFELKIRHFVICR